MANPRVLALVLAALAVTGASSQEAPPLQGKSTLVYIGTRTSDTGKGIYLSACSRRARKSFRGGLETRHHEGAGRDSRWSGRHAEDRPLDRLSLQGDENRKLCSLYLGIMDRMGVKMDAFGDATTRLAEL